MAEIAETTCSSKILSKEEASRLMQQNSRLVTEYKASQLEKDAKKHWDLFYKRNENRFFKDRHWTTREFTELLDQKATGCTRSLLEVGCGVGNFIFPLLEENLDLKIFACDLSSHAIEIVKNHKLYECDRVTAFQTDITTQDIFNVVGDNSIDIITLIFVLSAIHPEKFLTTLKIIWKLLKPGGILLFRDYGLHDMAQLRFKAGHKISDNFYMRQDGTRSYFFSIDFLSDLFQESGYAIIENNYIHRRTINKKENIDVPRIFVQAKLIKPK